MKRILVQLKLLTWLRRPLHFALASRLALAACKVETGHLAVQKTTLFHAEQVRPKIDSAVPVDVQDNPVGLVAEIPELHCYGSFHFPFAEQLGLKDHVGIAIEGVDRL